MRKLTLKITTILVLASVPVFFTACASEKQTSQERWLFLGNSITQAGHYVDYVETWFLLNEERPPEILSLGLSSETVSGLSEPGHPFPRPCVHTRLKEVLERVQPDVVVACYGMNCAIYHPFSEERFQAYQEGIRKLIADVHAGGAELILLTPPPYAGAVKPKSPPGEGESYGYQRPAPDYNETLGRYAAWIMSMDGEMGVRAFDIRPPLEKYMELSYPIEPVHPSEFGHKLMAESFLSALGMDSGSDLLESGIDRREGNALWHTLLDLVRQERQLSEMALMNDIGHGNPGVLKRHPMSMEDAEMAVKPIRARMDSVLLGEYGLPGE